MKIDLPYDAILQAITECVSDLDKSESINGAFIQRMFAPVDKMQDQRDTRAKKAEAYSGTYRRAFESVKGEVEVQTPMPIYATHD
jgi:hypothetical protein